MLLIGSMSIGTGVVYIQFHPLVYLIKLHIELNMAELMAKVVRASNPINTIDTTLCSQSLKPGETPHPPLHRDPGIAPTYMNKEVDRIEADMQLSGIHYHEALRPTLSAQRSPATDATFDNAYGEGRRGDFNQ